MPVIGKINTTPVEEKKIEEPIVYASKQVIINFCLYFWLVECTCNC
jgi:hypothetical protein